MRIQTPAFAAVALAALTALATFSPGATRNTSLAQARGFTPPALAITLMPRSLMSLPILAISGGKSRA